MLENPRTDSRRTVGEAVTSSTRQADGWYEMTSRVEFDAGDLLRGTVLADARQLSGAGQEPSTMSTLSGNLQNFDLLVASQDLGDELVHVSGRLREGRWRSSLAGRCRS